jgi:AcrR family transcriptional regulator
MRMDYDPPMPRSRKATRRPARGQGREALLKAVVRVVARQGLDALTYRAVATEAGVTHGLVSYHFGSREAMIHETLAWAIAAATRESLIGEEAHSVGEFASRLPELVADDPDAQAFQHQLHYEVHRSRESAEEVHALRGHYLRTVEDSLGRLGLDRDEPLARLVLAALDGLVMQQLVFRDPTRTAGAIERLQQLLELAREHGLERRSRRRRLRTA